MPRPSVASDTPGRGGRSGHQGDPNHRCETASTQAASTPVVDPWARIAGIVTPRNSSWSTKPDHRGEQATPSPPGPPWSRRRRGSQVSTVVIVPARHSAPATDAPPRSAPSSNGIAATIRIPSPLPETHQSAMRAGWVPFTRQLRHALSGRVHEGSDTQDDDPDEGQYEQHPHDGAVERPAHLDGEQSHYAHDAASSSRSKVPAPSGAGSVVLGELEEEILERLLLRAQLGDPEPLRGEQPGDLSGVGGCHPDAKMAVDLLDSEIGPTQRVQPSR